MASSKRPPRRKSRSIRAVGIAVVLMVLVLTVQYSSLMKPAVIMIVVPMEIIGVLIGFLRKHHMPIVPSLHDVMRIVRKHYSSKSRHRSTPTPSVSTETAVSPKTPSRENRSVPVFTCPRFYLGPRFYLVPVFPSPFLGRRWLGIQNACPMLT